MLLGVVGLNVALLATLFLPWRHVSITTSPALARHVLSVTATRRAIDAVHRALAIQSVLRAVIELTTLAAVSAVVMLAARRLLDGQRGGGSSLVVLAAVGVGLTGIACFGLPLVNNPAGLTVRLVATTSPAAYGAFGMTVASLALLIVARRHDRGPDRR